MHRGQAGTERSALESTIASFQVSLLYRLAEILFGAAVARGAGERARQSVRCFANTTLMRAARAMP